MEMEKKMEIEMDMEAGMGMDTEVEMETCIGNYTNSQLDPARPNPESTESTEPA